MTEERPEHTSGELFPWWVRQTIAAGLAMLGMLLAVIYFEDYGWSLFVGIPICLGFVSTILYCRNRPATLWDCLKQVTLISSPIALLFLLLGLEGLICILMVTPLALGLLWIGATLAFLVQYFHYLKRSQGALLVLSLLASPLMMGFEDIHPAPPARDKVETSVEIQAAPDTVWQVLTSFPDLPAPEAAYFKLGIAYPKSARITHPGVGGKITWTFTTGEVLERVTTWQPGKLLAYEILSEPEMMRELSPYDLHPPHLKGYFQSDRGYFRLEALPGGKTRLIGHTAYSGRMWPAFYWMPQASWLHGKMQKLVLENIRQRAEISQTVYTGSVATMPVAQPKK